MQPIRLWFSLFLLLLTVFGCQQKETAQQAPPLEIPVIIIQLREVRLPIEFVGQVYGSKDIAIRARVEGFLVGIHFEEGSEVKKGDLLYVIESQPFEADVAAMMSHVAEAKTILAKATSDLNRIRPLAKRKAVSQSDLDSAVAQYEASQASVEAAEARLRASKIQLSYTKIYSPINGIIGKTKAKVGDFVGRDPNPVILNVVSNTDPVHVEFFLTESQYLQLARRYSMGPSEIPKASEEVRQEAPLEMILADDSLFSDQGQFEFIDREIDPTTGAILIQVSFPNPQKIIRPGQFAKIRTILDVIPNGILVPQRCVMELQGRYRVYVVSDDNKVEERPVVLGPTLGGDWLIREGLNAGEKVVYEGLQKVRDGATVKPVVQDIETLKSENNQEK
jgi:membrane fusion protein (multidrug efflux system)